MDLMELNEARQQECYDKLGKLDPGDPKRESIVDDLMAFAKIQAIAENHELKRLDNNAKNDIEETRLIIEQQANEIQRMRMRLEFSTRIMYAFGAGLMGFYAYNKELITIPAKSFIKVKDDLLHLISSRW